MQSSVPWWRSAPVIGAVAAIAGFMVADVVLGRLSGRAPDWTLFLGRMHPLVVHLPIGIFVLVATAEAGTLVRRLRPLIDPALGLVLPVLVVSAGAAFVLGHLLAHEGGFASRPLLLHRRLVLVGAMGASLCLIAWTYGARTQKPAARAIYRLVLAASLGVLSIGAHFGGTLTRGDAYLVKYAPGPLKGLLGATAEPRAKTGNPSKTKDGAGHEPLLFGDGVQPLLKGSLRLDSLESILKGGETGAAVVPGKPRESLIIERVRLPVDDEDHMPPEDEKQLTPEEVALLEFWIDRGANASLAVKDLLAPASARGLLEKAVQSASVAKPAERAETPAPASTVKAAPAPSSAPPGAGTSQASLQQQPNAVEPSKTADAEPPSPPLESPAPGAIAILTEKCGKCHGAQKQKGKLRVDSLDALLRGGKGGAAIVPGQPDRSEVIVRAKLPLDDKDHMPPKKEPQLTAAELGALRAFIARSANSARSGEAKGTRPAASATAEPAETPGQAAPNDAPASPERQPSPEPDEATNATTETASLKSSAEDQALLDRLPKTVALFSEAVHPLLLERCGKCHQGAFASGSLRVKKYSDLLTGGSSGPAVVAGNPGQSTLFQRVALPLSDSDHMPPEDEPQLTANQVQLLRSWIELGASADATVPTSQLPPPARFALAERLEATAPPKVAPERAEAAGCAACSVGGDRGAPAFSWGFATVLAIGLGARRKRRDLRRDG